MDCDNSLMPSIVEKYPEGGGHIICLRRHRNYRRKCFYCNRPHEKLCDGPSLTAPSVVTKTCDRPLCSLHAYHVLGKDLDYCEDHKPKG